MAVVLFVGDKPSSKMKPGAKPFEGAACEKRLMEWINYINPSSYDIINKDQITYLNMYDTFMDIFYDRKRFIALGNNAAKELEKWGLLYFKLPHPSGLNRQINDKEFIKNKLKEAKDYIDHSQLIDCKVGLIK